MGPNASAPAQYAAFVTASDGSDLPGGTCRGLLVGSAGNARVVFANGSDSGATNLLPLQAGYNVVEVKRIYATGLTASNIWALY